MQGWLNSAQWCSGPQLGWLDSWGLKLSEGLFTHMSGAWPGLFWRQGVEMKYSCFDSLACRGGLGVAWLLTASTCVLAKGRSQVASYHPISKVTRCHFHHTLVLEVVISLLRFKRKGIRLHFLMGKCKGSIVREHVRREILWWPLEGTVCHTCWQVFISTVVYSGALSESWTPVCSLKYRDSFTCVNRYWLLPPLSVSLIKQLAKSKVH